MVQASVGPRLAEEEPKYFSRLALIEGDMSNAVELDLLDSSSHSLALPALLAMVRKVETIPCKSSRHVLVTAQHQQ